MPRSCFLYYITDRAAFPGDEPARQRRLLEKIAEATAANIDYIQLREKDLTTRNLESLASEAASVIHRLRAENRELRTKFLINSRTEVALAAAADGVHLPANDVLPQDVRAAWRLCGAVAHARDLGRSPQISISCHSPEEVTQAAAKAATLALFAPVFEKKDAVRIRPQGIEELRQACRVNIPVVALGGIALDNARSCLQAGAAGIAAIRLFQENDIATIARTLRS